MIGNIYKKGYLRYKIIKQFSPERFTVRRWGNNEKPINVGMTLKEIEILKLLVK